MRWISFAIIAILSSLVFSPGASADSDAPPSPLPLQQAAFNPAQDVAPSLLSAVQPREAALNAMRNPAFELAIPGRLDSPQQKEPALSKPAAKATERFQPLSMLLLGAGMIGLAGLGRRRFKYRRSERGTAFDTSKKIIYENG